MAIFDFHKFPFWKLLFIILAFISFGAAIYFYFSSKMIQNTDHVIFLSDTETQHVLNQDADHYYQTFHKVDLKVRKSKNLQDYLAKIAKSGCEGSEENKEKIIDCIEKVNKQLYNKRSDTVEGINIGSLLDLPWKIGFTCDKFYENGLPHTRGDVIVLNNLDIERRNMVEMCRLLIHEKVHVYQKSSYKEEFQKSLETKYEKTDKLRDAHNAPANPDIDAHIYRKKDDDTLMDSTYSKNPKHFRDVKFPNNDHTLEHPFESVAYSLENLYS